VFICAHDELGTAMMAEEYQRKDSKKNMIHFIFLLFETYCQAVRRNFMSDQALALPARLSKTTLITVSIDICRMTSIIREIDDEIKTVLFIDGFYSLCTQYIEPLGGEIVKYMGDSCLATFPADKSVEAIESVSQLRSAFQNYCESMSVQATDIQAGLHVDEAFVGEFGPLRQRDISAKSSGIAIQLMSGSGITISEQLYRKLPSANRNSWRKTGGRVTYDMQ